MYKHLVLSKLKETIAMVLATGAADRQQADRVAWQLLAEDDGSFITRGTGIVMVTPAMSSLLHYGLCRYGHVRESLALLQRRFNRMLDPETNRTIWEEWWRDGTARSGVFQKRTRSDAQTESAFPPALFGEFILGIRPLKPGLREVELTVPDCGLAVIEGSIPSPKGILSVRWDMAERDLLIEIPQGMQVRFVLPSDASIQILNNGNHHVRF